MQKLKIFLVLGATFMLPVVTFAAKKGTVEYMIDQIAAIIGALIPVVMAIALLIFFWGLAMYMFKADDSTARGEAINIMVMGVIVLFVMVSVWGLVGLLGKTFSVSGADGKAGDSLTAPSLPGPAR